MRYRAIFSAIAFVFSATLLVAPGQAQAAETITASGFGSSGLSMADWRWLSNEGGNAYVSWVFTDPRVGTDDLHLHFTGLAAFGPGSSGSITLRVHYGIPGTGEMGGAYAETNLTLNVVAGQTGPVGVPVSGDVLITAAMIDAIAPSTRRFALRIEQSENQGVSVAFKREGVIITPSPSEEAGIGAAEFKSNGDLIQTWYWLRDGALLHYATWRIDGVTVPTNDVRLAITALATDRVNGGPGVDAEFRLRYGTSPSVWDGSGGSTMSVHLPNISPPNDPVGYTNHDVVALPAATLGGAGRTGTLYLRVERETASGPHVAFNAGSMSVEQKGAGGTEEGGGGTGGGTGTAVTITVEDGGRRLISSVPFLVAANEEGGPTDADKDGVLQAFEDAALTRLNPKIELDEDEGWLKNRSTDHVVQFGRVRTFPSELIPRYLLVYFGTTWSRDYGRETIPATGLWYYKWYNANIAIKHNGDVENVIEAWEITGDTTAELRFVFTSAHRGSETDHSGVWAASGSSCNEGKVKYSLVDHQTICSVLLFEDGRVKVAASQGKHAFYPTVPACELVHLVASIGEDCGGSDPFIFDVYNIGEKEVHLLDDIGWLFHGEYVWRGAFCGGKDGTYDPNLPCPADIAASLTNPPDPPDILAAHLLRAPKTIPDGMAQMYDDANFGGAYVELSTSSALSNLFSIGGTATGANDMISSIKMGRGISCTFYEHPNFQGATLGPHGPFTYADAPDGEWPDLTANGFNDKISSVRCQAAP